MIEMMEAMEVMEMMEVMEVMVRRGSGRSFRQYQTGGSKGRNPTAQGNAPWALK